MIQPPIQQPNEVIELAARGAATLLKLVEERIWGAQSSQWGTSQLDNFCRFVSLHHEGEGVEEIANTLGVHRSTIPSWRKGLALPYMMKLAVAASSHAFEPGWKILPMRLSSGAGEQMGWISAPVRISTYQDIEKVVAQLPVLPLAVDKAARFGIDPSKLNDMRTELFGYLLAMMAGDSSKSGGKLERFASMNLDLQLTLKHDSNERLGRFVCMCANTLGLEMKRIADKAPTGMTRLGKQPSAAYRWISERSPLLAWRFSVGLGLSWKERTSYNRLHMDWIFTSPRGFRLRFAQGLADSDGAVHLRNVRITTVPNAEFVSLLLRGLGAKSAHVITEGGQPIRTYISSRDAANLPLFNEFVRGYRYERLRARAEKVGFPFVTAPS
ncbi:MAG: hypothetical protein HY297_02500 [Thaumarchaeota archaeon]|nr:hypothetical protein [Nitrososphaerota archaeon]